MNGAQALIKTLLNGGVDVCFTNPGTSEMHFVAALDQVEGMRAVLGLFEGVCTGAADGYARMTGKPASTLLHLGPGLGNGFANLHNARRAQSPLVNIIGEHATYHIQHDAPLTTDIEGIARPVSGWVRTTQTPDRVSQDTAEAIAAANGTPGQIATLILPGDASWNPTSAPLASHVVPPKPAFDETAVQKIAAILKSDAPTLLMVSGTAVLGEGLNLLGKISAKSGATLMSNRPTARRQLGAGRPAMNSLAYPLPLSLKQLDSFAHIVLISTAEPVAFFAYPNMPGRLAPDHAQIHTLVNAEEDVVGALGALAEAIGVTGKEKTAVYTQEPLPLPTGELNLDTIWQSVGAQLPEQAILVNESLTSGRGAGTFLRNIVPFDMLYGTGGAIGHGLPQSVGAAIACPDRQVVTMQADGSAMYTIQALWTQARESLNIVTVLFNNRAYRILQSELKHVGAVRQGNIADSILNLDNPQLDFVHIARGMGVEASRAETAVQFNDQFAAALKNDGPHLIEVLV